MQAVERTCHDTIVALVGGTPLKVDDGSGKEGMYGYDDDGGRLIVEAKAPSGELDWRQGRADPEDPSNPRLGDDGGAQGMRVKQGTKPYIRTILSEMTRRGGRDAEIAKELRTALADGKLQYILVKANDNPGYSYVGAVLEHLKI